MNDDFAEREFIITYNRNECEILSVDSGFLGLQRREFYKEALTRKPGFEKEYGTIVGWNNQFWGSVKAKNAKDALDHFIEKWKYQDSQEKQGL